MENDIRKMNVLVLGNSGSGKSTLISAISGAEIETKAGGGNTQRITVYESSTWPFRLIDTVGFEYNIFEQIKAINLVKQFTNKSAASDESGGEEGAGIDAVWYCIDGTVKRVFPHNIRLMNRAVKKWRNVPVFVVLTKSYSEPDIEENTDAVVNCFAKNGGSVNLQKIIPVVAKPFPINSETVVEPRGIEELCGATLDCYDKACEINRENRERMMLEQKRFTANAIVAGAAALGVIVGAVPSIPVADSAILVPLETGMTKGILKIYDVGITGDLLAAVVGSAAITNIAKAAVSTLKTIPNVAGSVINAVVAGVFVTAIGESVIALSEAINTGRIDKDKIDSVSDFLAAQLKENKAIGTGIKYINENSDKLGGKSAKEIFEDIGRIIKTDKKRKNT